MQPAADTLTATMQSQIGGGWRGAGERAVLEAAGPALGDAASAMVAGTVPAGARLVKDAERSRVAAVELAGRRWSLKVYRLGRCKARLQGWLRLTPAHREYRGGRRLLAAGLAVAAPVAVLARGADVAVVAPWVDGPTVAEMLRDHGRDATVFTAGRRVLRLRLARALGQQMGSLWSAGLINRDYKPTNLILREVAPAACAAGAGEEDAMEPTLVMIDPLGVRRRQAWGGHGQAIRMLAVLGRSVQRAGSLTVREALTCARAMRESDRRLGRRGADLLRSALAVNRSRPLSWGPGED